MANHIIAILHKKRLPPVKLRLLGDGERAADHPKRFTGIALTFEVQGAVPQQVLDDVIQLAKDKYCSVLNTIGPDTTITITSRIVPG